MDHARAGEVGLGEEAGHAGQVHAGGRVHVGVPGDARVGGPGHVALALVTWGLHLATLGERMYFLS